MFILEYSYEPSGADVYSSGKEACEAGLRDIEVPSLEARGLIRKLRSRKLRSKGL